MREPPHGTCSRPLSAGGHSHDLAPAAFDLALSAFNRAFETGDPSQASALPNIFKMIKQYFRTVFLAFQTKYRPPAQFNAFTYNHSS